MTGRVDGGFEIRSDRRVPQNTVRGWPNSKADRRSKAPAPPPAAPVPGGPADPGRRAVRHRRRAGVSSRSRGRPLLSHDDVVGQGGQTPSGPVRSAHRRWRVGGSPWVVGVWVGQPPKPHWTPCFRHPRTDRGRPGGGVWRGRSNVGVAGMRGDLHSRAFREILSTGAAFSALPPPGDSPGRRRFRG